MDFMSVLIGSSLSNRGAFIFVLGFFVIFVNNRLGGCV